MSTLKPHPDSLMSPGHGTAPASFGAFARHMRQARGLTLERAAQAAGVGRVTLTRWENGIQRPRLRELEALLGALGATSGERRQAMALLDTPESHALVREEVARVGERLGLGPQPGGGDLLRAMRQRRGLSPEETAVRIGVSARTLRRWERGEVWPPTDRLHALCYALGAREAEVVVLTVGNFGSVPSSALEAPTVEKVTNDVLLTHGRVQMGVELLVELLYLTLEAQAWRLATLNEAGRDVFRLTLHSHAIALGNRGDGEASRRIAERVLELGPGPDSAHPKLSWVHSGVMLASDFQGDSPSLRPPSAWKLLRSLLGMTPLNYMKAWILSVMADCLVAQGAGEEALALGEEACRIAERSEYVGHWDQRRADQAKRLLLLGQPARTLNYLDGLTPNTPLFGIGFSMSRTEALLGVGDTAGAEASLQNLYADIETYDLAQMRGPVDRLAARLAA